MGEIWVYKFSGKIQCDEASREIPLEEMRQELAVLIGDHNILSMEGRVLQMIQLCGMPAGGVNAYQITPEGWFLLQHGFTGNGGFFRWKEHNKQTEGGQLSSIVAMLSEITSVENTPSTVRDLVGRPLRVYRTGEALTEDFIQNRVNIELEPENGLIIVNIWFG